ncbi:hypothetical protein [Flavobacterium selenitireducens]|uniref:hypothetical protein n=1 Tax=Flavobacterium selenitireducens TaxID=2722704 RepID=UPI00168A644D|nr:hypothetical protein [Flavobacterium selenitireducens]MBD3581182.1 hypothetical protein [Flavobacterium selenitireducens]
MKKITLLLPIIVVSFFCQGQVPVHSESLLDKKIRFTSLPSAKTENVFKTRAEIEKTHKVVAVMPYENLGTTKFKLQLQSAEKGTFYYDYDPRYDQRYILDVVGSL